MIINRGTSGERRRKQTKMAEAPGAPRGRGTKTREICAVQSFFARIGPVRGCGESNVWVLVAITIIDVVATNISIKAT